MSDEFDDIGLTDPPPRPFDLALERYRAKFAQTPGTWLIPEEDLDALAPLMNRAVDRGELLDGGACYRAAGLPEPGPLPPRAVA